MESPAVQRALEQLLLPHPARKSGAGMGDWQEQVHYVAARAAKLDVSLAMLQAALAAFRPLAVTCLSRTLRTADAVAAVEWFQQQAQLALAEACLEGQNGAVRALLAVLDAELGAGNLPQLLQRLLEQAAQIFPLRWGEVLLCERSAGGVRLRHAASYGFERGLIMDAAGAGAFFQQIAQTGRPAFLLDAANDPRVAQPYYRELEVKSVWAAPLCRGREVLGILSVAFDRAYECLPKERELLLALAERSTLAIERTRMHEQLAQEQERVLELSRRLLAAHEEERRRISRDLHDETGQALLALRLYLEMGLRPHSQADTRKWLKKGLALVDDSVAELRRILAELSPLALDQQGLEAALRGELRRLRAEQHWRTRFLFAVEQPLPRPTEALLYRVAVEGLRNAARHAQAHRVSLRLTARDGSVQLDIADDGIGLPPGDGPRGFGLTGMRERVRLAGGRFHLGSTPGAGVHLTITIPAAAARAAAAHA